MNCAFLTFYMKDMKRIKAKAGLGYIGKQQKISARCTLNATKNPPKRAMPVGCGLTEKSSDGCELNWD